MKEFEKNIKRIKTVWQFAKPYKLLFFIAEICILILYTVSLLLPLNLTRLTDSVLYGKNYDLLSTVIRDYFILFTVSTVINLIYAYTWQTLNNKYVVDVKIKVFEKTIHAKAKFLSNMNSGDVMSRIDYDADQFIYIVQRNLFHFLNSILLCAGIIYIVSTINIYVSLMLVIAAFIPIFLTRISGKFTAKYSKHVREITGDFSGKLFEILKGMREIKLLCAQWWATKNIFPKLNKIIRLGNDIKKVDFIVNKGTYIINLSVSIVIYGFCAYLIVNGQLTVGIFLAVIQYIALLHKKFNWMLRIYLDWYARKISVDRVNEILDSESEDNDGKEITKKIELIEFDNVSFAYEQNRILNNVSFKINKGERVAIVGTSGVGKTTITGLILKFLEPQSGTIYINGENINNLKYSDIRNQIGIVQQDILLFDETIKYNLLLGNKDCTDDEILCVCEKVGLLQLVESLPQGINTKIGTNAHGLSGGQKQRIMIARILLKGAETIIFDEATSALDIETEQQVVSEFAAISPDTTVIVISHRLATIRSCDRIIVIENGKVESIGHHENLISNSEVYKSLFESGVA
jgi:ATP-binding cassette subfamily B protein